MLLKTTQNGDVLVSTIKIKEGSLQNADQFKLELIAQVNKGFREIVLSFKEVEYVDSSFLGALVSSLKHALSLKSDIILTDLQQNIYELLCMIRMDKVFKIYKTTEEAFGKLKLNAAAKL